MASVVRTLDLSLRTKVLGAISLAVLPLGASLALFGAALAQDEWADRRVSQSRKLRIAVAALRNGAVDAETGVRGYLLTGKRSFLEPYERAQSDLDAHVADVRRYSAPLDMEVESVQALTERELAILAAVVRRPSDASVTALVERGKRIMDQLRAETDEWITRIEAETDEVIRARNRARSNAYRTLLIGAGVGALSSVAAGAVLVGNFVRRVEKNTENARRLAEGGDLLAPETGTDEIADLSRRLHETALLLRARESALRQAREEADNANRAKSEFLSRMSHELRTPLNAVIGFAQLLQDQVSAEDREDVREILRAGHHLLALIDEVLDLSRIESGTIRMSVEPVSLGEVVNESVNLVRGQAAERSIDIGVSGVDGEWQVRADRQRLKQVLVNLLSNSVKYNRDDGSVHVAVARDDGWIRLGVTDQGNGIPERLQRDLFTPFSRLGAERTSVEGTGLGLALSKHLVEAMGGEIGVETEVGSGSTFWVALPHAAGTETMAVPTSDTTVMAAAPGSGTPITVLQFEDNPSNVRLMERALRSRRDITLLTAMTGREGFEILDEHGRPDLVLLDVNLPDTSGTDILVRLRANPATRDLPVVVLSADATQAQVDHMLALGAERYLTKPIDMQVLNEVLDAAATRAEGDRGI